MEDIVWRRDVRKIKNSLGVKSVATRYCYTCGSELWDGCCPVCEAHERMMWEEAERKAWEENRCPHCGAMYNHESDYNPEYHVCARCVQIVKQSESSA